MVTRTKQCQACGKCFERSDSLRRHTLTHDERRPPPKSRKRACVACTKSKLKCTGGKPECSRCHSRRIPCVYIRQHQQSHVQDITTSTPLSSSQLSPPNEPPKESITSALLPERTTVAGDTAQLTPVGPSPGFADSDAFSFFGDPGFDTNFAWLANNSFDDVAYIPDFLQSDLSAVSEAASANATMPITVPFSDAVIGQTMNISPSSEPSKLGRPIPDPDEHDAPEDRWPMEWRAVPVQIHRLPVLERSLLGVTFPSHFLLPKLDTSSLDRIKCIMQLPQERSPWQTVSIADFPSSGQLDHCLDLYFLHFDAFFPIIHRSSFNPNKDLALTGAMAAIGACYTAFEGRHAFAGILAELARRVLHFMAEYDPRFIRTEEYIATELLLSVFGFSSGIKRLWENSESTRSALINHARCIALYDRQPPPDKSALSTEGLWVNWIRQERRRRLAWSIYLLDSSSIYLRNTRPYLSVSEIKIDMPSSADHWEAATHQAWAALHPWTEYPPPAMGFEQALAICFNMESKKNRNVKELDNFQMQIVLATLARSAYNCKEADTSATATFLPSSSMQDEDRALLLTVACHWGTKLRTRLVSFESEKNSALYTCVHLSQMAQMLVSGNASDYMHLMWRGGSRVEEGRAHLLAWAQADPVRVRRNMVFLAQMLATTRLYPHNSPSEASNAFHSGFCFWCLAGLLQRPPSTGGTCRLDWLGSDDDAEAAIVRDWVETGRPYRLSLFGVPDLHARDGGRQVLQQTADVLGRMHVWSIAQTFRNAIVSFLKAGMA